MASQEHERSSSSPSVKIERLARRKGRRPGEEIEVVLSDASSFFVSMRVWEEAPFHEGDILDAQRWESILSRTDLIRTRGQAVALLARSEHSRFLLRQKLLQRGYTSQVVEPILDSLEEEGVLSDRRFATSWVRSRLRSHPEGVSHLIAGLRSRGVDAAIAERSVRRVLEEESLTMTESAGALVERFTRRRSLTAGQNAERLYRRGYAAAVVREVVSGLETDNPTEDRGFAHEE